MFARKKQIEINAYQKLNVDDMKKRHPLSGQPLFQRLLKADSPEVEDHLAMLIFFLESKDPVIKAAAEELLNTPDKAGLFPIHTAALHGRTDCVEYLLRRFPQLYHQQTQLGEFTALHCALAHPQTLAVFLRDPSLYGPYLNKPVKRLTDQTYQATPLDLVLAKYPDSKLNQNLWDSVAALKERGAYHMVDQRSPSKLEELTALYQKNPDVPVTPLLQALSLTARHKTLSTQTSTSSHSSTEMESSP